jgi:hypothetical protein
MIEVSCAPFPTTYRLARLDIFLVGNFKVLAQGAGVKVQVWFQHEGQLLGLPYDAVLE